MNTFVQENKIALTPSGTLSKAFASFQESRIRIIKRMTNVTIVNNSKKKENTLNIFSYLLARRTNTIPDYRGKLQLGPDKREI